MRVKRSGFIEGTLIATIAIIITKILGMLYVIPFYAIVGVKGSALYAYAYNIYVIFLDISSAGIPSAMSKIIKEYQTLGHEDAKVRAYKLGRKMIFFISMAIFIILFIFASSIATLILGDLSGGNTIEDVTLVIRAVSLAILIIPFLSVTKGYLQGHNVIGISSASQVIEQIIRIAITIGGSYLGIKVFKIGLKYSVSLALLGAFVGGVIAILYIYIKIRKHKKELSLEGNLEKDKITDREIVKKIWYYALPFIAINVAASIYNFVDMVFISRTMGYLGYDAAITEFVTSAVTTWSGKIGMVVNAIAMGLTVSLIPNVVEAYTLKKWDVVSDRFNKAIQIIVTVCVPMVLGIMFLSKPLWNVFYGAEQLDLGASILATYTILCIFYNLFMITTSTLQSINKFRLVLLSTIIGYAANAILDVPFMILCHKLGISPYIGAFMACVVGYSISIFIPLIKLNKEYNIKYNKTILITLKTIIPCLVMFIPLVLFKSIYNYDELSRLSCVIYIAIASVLGALTYFVVAFKLKIFDDILGTNVLKIIKQKISFKSKNK